MPGSAERNRPPPTTPGHRHPPYGADQTTPGRTVRDVPAHRRGGSPPRRETRPPHHTGKTAAAMGGTHGTKAAKDPRGLRRLPQHHPQSATNRDTRHGIVIGELDDRKRSCPVREGVVGSRTSTRWHLARRPTSPSEHRDLAAARRFFTRALSHGRRPVEVTTDKAAAYPRVLDELLPGRPPCRCSAGEQPDRIRSQPAASPAPADARTDTPPLCPGDRFWACVCAEHPPRPLRTRRRHRPAPAAVGRLHRAHPGGLITGLEGPAMSRLR